MFGSQEFDTSLRHSAGTRLLHGDSDIILTNDYHSQAFHQPNTRKITKITPKENHSLTNNSRSTSHTRTTNVVPLKNETKMNIPTPTDVQRLKNVRRHEPAHVASSSTPSKNLITPDSWKHYPVVLKTPAVKKPPTKPVKTEEKRASSADQPPAPKKPETDRPKRARSRSKPPQPEPVPPKKQEKTEEEKEKIRKYIQDKRQEQEKNLLSEKQQRIEQEKQRKQKLKQLNEQIKKVAQQPLPPALAKKANQTQLSTKDPTEQTRERLIEILGPRVVYEPPAEIHPTTPFEEIFERERSPSESSSSSSSSESVVEIQRPQVNQTVTRAPSGMEQRQQSILRWAMNLTRDCDNIETKFKYLRPDGTQPFDLIPPSQVDLKNDDGNLRSPVPFIITNGNRVEPEIKTPSKLLRPSGRLINLNRNQTSEYENEQLPGIGNLRDPLLEQRVKRDRAATKIQSAYRGYTVRKSLQWINDKPQRQTHHFHKRSTRRPTKVQSYLTDSFDKPALNLDMRLSDDKFTIGSTLLRQFQRNGINIISPPSPLPPPLVVEQPKVKTPEPRVQKPSSLRTYSDDYENMTSTRSSTPTKQKSSSQINRTVKARTSDSESTSTVTTSSTTTTASPQPAVFTNVQQQRRRSISPPPPLAMSPDNGRVKAPATAVLPNSRRVFDERRYSPDALERQLNAELHLLDGVEASMKQIDNMERLRSVTLAQQEVVSLAQILKNKPTNDISSRQAIRKSSPSTISSSSSSSSLPPRRKRQSDTQSSTSSSEMILTAREKRFRQKYHNETELKAYEKRLQDVEKKIRSLVKRATNIFDDKTPVQSPRKSDDNDSSISEEIPVSQRSSSSTSSTVQEKPTKDTSEIYTETFEKDTVSSVSSQQPKSETITTDVSQLERRINKYHEQLKSKKAEFDKLKHKKTRDDLRRQENELKKQLENYNKQIENMQKQEKTLPLPARISPIKTTSSSSSSSSSTPTKQHESSIAEELPAASTASQSNSKIIKGKERDFFDDDDDELPPPKKPEIKPLETPREERDTHHDAQSISSATDLAGLSETEHDLSRRTSTDTEKSILNFNTIIPPPLQSKDPSSSSSSSSASTPSKKSPKANSIVHDYDEDFSEDSRSPSTPIKETPPQPQITELDIESIHEDLDDKQSAHSTTRSPSSKSSDDEQSEILVLNRKSANTTPRIADEKTFEDELPLPPTSPRPQQIEPIANDDTSHDISEDEEIIEQENKVDKFTELFLRTFIDEAIDQGKEIKRMKTDVQTKRHLLTQEAKEWVSEDDDLTDDEHAKSPSPVESNELAIDLSGLNDKSADDGPLSTARKDIVEEPIVIFVPHTREQVIDLTRQAVNILFEQNASFEDRENIRAHLPNSYFQQESDVEDVRRNHQAYCQMIMDLSMELLHELYSNNIQLPKYPEWEKEKLIPKRFTRGRKPQNRQEAERLVAEKILEILDLNSRQITYSKWRVTPNRRADIDKFETVLDEEIRRTESQWINYDDDCTQLKFDIADSIFDQLIQETLTDCLTVVNTRFSPASNSTRF